MTGSLESAGALAVGLLFCVSTVPCRYAHFRRSFLSVKWSTVGCFTLISSPNHSVTTHWKTSEDENISDRKATSLQTNVKKLKSRSITTAAAPSSHQLAEQNLASFVLQHQLTILFCFLNTF